METTGYKLVELLRKTADECMNPKTTHVLTWGADEITALLEELRILEKEGKTLLKHLNDSRAEAVEFRDSIIAPEWSTPKRFYWENSREHPPA